MVYASKSISSPVGMLKLVASERGLAAILWENDDPERVRLAQLVEDPTHPILMETERQLADYFAGKLRAFDVPLDFKGTRPEERLGSPADKLVRGDTQLWGYRAPDWPADCVAGRGRRKRQEPDLDHCTLPSCDRIDRSLDWVRGRPRHEGAPARARRSSKRRLNFVRARRPLPHAAGSSCWSGSRTVPRPEEGRI
jgi:6-O-methylguanine DNA methyltransferase-like protein